MPRVLITTEALHKNSGPHLPILQRAGFEVCYTPRGFLLSEEETLAAMQDMPAVIAGSEPYTDRVLAGLPKLRVISRNGVGYDRIDVPAATRRGVAVTITPEGNHQAVAEHALALLLCVTRSIARSAAETRTGQWRRQNVHIPLRGKTLGIVGLGRIGRSVAVRAEAFGLKLIACETYPNVEFVRRHDIELVDLDTLLSRADFVSLHAPMGPETQDLINRDTLARMKPGSVLINTARGGLVNEQDLLAVLKSGHLAGAGLDVLQCEPPPADHPLLRLENVVVTPHVSSLDTQAIVDMSVAAAQNLVDLFAGRTPRASLVNPEVMTHWKA